jgi:hypothetical protein
MAGSPKLGICPFPVLLFYQHATIRKREAIILFDATGLVPEKEPAKHLF